MAVGNILVPIRFKGVLQCTAGVDADFNLVVGEPVALKAFKPVSRVFHYQIDQRLSVTLIEEVVTIPQFVSFPILRVHQTGIVILGKKPDAILIFQIQI